MNRKEVIDILSERCKLSQPQVDSVLIELKEIVKQQIIVGEEIRLNGFFRLEYSDVKEFVRPNPTTGEMKLFPAHRIPRIKLSKELRKLA